MKMCLAPMDWITDCAYRIICKEIFERVAHSTDELMLWTEFMSADGYYHNPPWVIKHILKTDYDHETIAQIFWWNTDTLVACAQDIDKKYDFAGIELNMGCPSPKIMKCAAGSGMLRDKKKTMDITKTISESITTPFSLKVRTWLSQYDVDEQFDFLVEASKYVGVISVHGRRYNQWHSGEVNRDFIYKLKERLPDTIIVWNGWIRSYEQALERCKRLDGIMIAQSAIGNPWVLTPHTPTLKEKYEVIIRHLHLSIACEYYFKDAMNIYDHTQWMIQPNLAQLELLFQQYINWTYIPEAEPHAVVEFRKFLFNYVSGIDKSKELKKAIACTRDYTTLKQLLDDFFLPII